jgi:hypothetical protein
MRGVGWIKPRIRQVQELSTPEPVDGLVARYSCKYRWMTVPAGQRQREKALEGAFLGWGLLVFYAYTSGIAWAFKSAALNWV